MKPLVIENPNHPFSIHLDDAPMSYISKSERSKIPIDDFGEPDPDGDPIKSKFPIRHQKDLNDAAHLIGKARKGVKERIIEIAKRKKLIIPQAWLGDNDAQPMSKHGKGLADGTVDNEHRYAIMTARSDFSIKNRRVVGDFAHYDNCVLFEAGDYSKTHNISISPEELDAAIADFQETYSTEHPLGGNVKHTDFLKDRAVFVDFIFSDPDDPYLLRCNARVPLGLDEILTDREKRLSAEWNTSTKQLVGVALEPNPAISHASLVAAFKKRHTTPHGQMKMQQIHDWSAQAGALCDPDGNDADNKDGMFTAHHERQGFQKIHDMTKEHGADCRSGKSYFTSNPLSPKGKSPMSTLTKVLKGLFGGGGDLPTAEGQLDDNDVKALFTALAPDTTLKPDPEPEPVIVNFSDTPEAKAMAAEIARLKAHKLDQDASAFADCEIKDEKRALPAERASLIALFKQATLDDEAPDGIARFAAKSETVPNRVVLLKSYFASRPRHMLYTEMLANPEPENSEKAVFVLPNKEGSVDANKVDPKEIERLRKYLSPHLQTAMTSGSK